MRKKKLTEAAVTTDKGSSNFPLKTVTSLVSQVKQHSQNLIQSNEICSMINVFEDRSECLSFPATEKRTPEVKNHPNKQDDQYIIIERSFEDFLEDNCENKGNILNDNNPNNNQLEYQQNKFEEKNTFQNKDTGELNNVEFKPHNDNEKEKNSMIEGCSPIRKNTINHILIKDENNLDLREQRLKEKLEQLKSRLNLNPVSKMDRQFSPKNVGNFLTNSRNLALENLFQNFPNTTNKTLNKIRYEGSYQSNFPSKLQEKKHGKFELYNLKMNSNYYKQSLVNEIKTNISTMKNSVLTRARRNSSLI